MFNANWNEGAGKAASSGMTCMQHPGVVHHLDRLLRVMFQGAGQFIEGALDGHIPDVPGRPGGGTSETTLLCSAIFTSNFRSARPEWIANLTET
jgi:hypothetical protein